MSHPCLNIDLNPRSIRTSSTTISFQINIRSRSPCDYTIRARSRYTDHYTNIKGNGLQTIQFEDLSPDTSYDIQIQNFFKGYGQMVRINGYESYTISTDPLHNILTIEPYQFNARAQVLLATPSDVNDVSSVHVSLTNLRNGKKKNFYVDYERDDKLIVFPLRSLDVDTEYEVEIEIQFRNSPRLRNEAKFRTRPARCTFRTDKVSVVSNRMSYFLTYSKIDHLLKKLFHKMALHFIVQLDPSIFINRNQNEINSLSLNIDELFALSKKGIQWTPQQIANKTRMKARKDALVQKSRDTKARNREDLYLGPFEDLNNFLSHHRGYADPSQPLHIELYHLLIADPQNEFGTTAKFLAQFFPGMNLDDRRTYFAQGFPGGIDDFIVFLKCLVKNPDDINDEGSPITERPDKKQPALRFVLRGSNISDPENYFGYIFLSNSSGGKDDMLTHLSIGGAFEDRERTIFHTENRVPLTYHVTDVCFNFRNFYQFENDRLVLQRGDRRSYTENDDGSVTFTHANPGQGPQDTTVRLEQYTISHGDKTIRLADFHVVVEGAQRGGRVSQTRKQKRMTRAKTRRNA